MSSRVGLCSLALVAAKPWKVMCQEKKPSLNVQPKDISSRDVPCLESRRVSNHPSLPSDKTQSVAYRNIKGPWDKQYKEIDQAFNLKRESVEKGDEHLIKVLKDLVSETDVPYCVVSFLLNQIELQEYREEALKILRENDLPYDILGAVSEK